MSKFFFASDLHGDLSVTEAILARYEAEGAERLILLGDLLYHGPRNDLPSNYAPKKVIERLNAYRDRILAVRGNCDTEVDQMVLTFPILADYALLHVDGFSMFLTHGHIYNESRLPPFGTGTVLAHGHTHIAENRMLECGMRLFNPGSISLPKGGQERQFGYWDGERFSHYTI